ncbi:MAG: hypothetical protein ACYCW6_29290 [Candidatus Xenobia bacterium]
MNTIASRNAPALAPAPLASAPSAPAGPGESVTLSTFPQDDQAAMLAKAVTLERNGRIFFQDQPGHAPTRSSAAVLKACLDGQMPGQIYVVTGVGQHVQGHSESSQHQEASVYWQDLGESGQILRHHGSSRAEAHSETHQTTYISSALPDWTSLRDLTPVVDAQGQEIPGIGDMTVLPRPQGSVETSNNWSSSHAANWEDKGWYTYDAGQKQAADWGN